MAFEEKYDVLEELGKGMFGVVKKCRNKETGEYFAAKIVRKTAKSKKEVSREIAMMNQLHHKKLAQIFDAYETSRQMLIIMELIAGEELFEKVVKTEQTLTEMQVVRYMRQILYGVQHMHEKRIVHLDLKPENILCVHGGVPGYEEIKLIDFGLARELKPGVSESVICGTPEFVAPEVISFDPVSIASDMWSIGVVTFVLLSGISPFLGDDDTETLQNVTCGEFDFEDEDETFDHISDEAKSFIEKLIVIKPNKRMTVGECFQHEWLKEGGTENIVDTSNLKKYLAKRRWMKSINAIKAIGRFSAGLSMFNKRKDESNPKIIELLEEKNKKNNDNNDNDNNNKKKKGDNDTIDNVDSKENDKNNINNKKNGDNDTIDNVDSKENDKNNNNNNKKNGDNDTIDNVDSKENDKNSNNNNKKKGDNDTIDNVDSKENDKNNNNNNNNKDKISDNKNNDIGIIQSNNQTTESRNIPNHVDKESKIDNNLIGCSSNTDDADEVSAALQRRAERRRIAREEREKEENNVLFNGACDITSQSKKTTNDSNDDIGQKSQDIKQKALNDFDDKMHDKVNRIDKNIRDSEVVTDKNNNEVILEGDEKVLEENNDILRTNTLNCNEIKNIITNEETKSNNDILLQKKEKQTNNFPKQGNSLKINSNKKNGLIQEDYNNNNNNQKEKKNSHLKCSSPEVDNTKRRGSLFSIFNKGKPNNVSMVTDLKYGIHSPITDRRKSTGNVLKRIKTIDEIKISTPEKKPLAFQRGETLRKSLKKFDSSDVDSSKNTDRNNSRKQSMPNIRVQKGSVKNRVAAFQG